MTEYYGEYYHVTFRPKDGVWVVKRDGGKIASGLFHEDNLFHARIYAKKWAHVWGMGVKVYDKDGNVIETIAPESV